MPDILSGIIGGLSSIGSILQQNQQNKFTEQTNEQNRQFALDMYNLQRRDAITDWNNANIYNSPAAQMQRFKDAGLSPHLIYGQMTNAPAVRTGDAPKFEAQSKQAVNTSGAIAQGLNSAMQLAEMNIAKQRIISQKLADEKTKAETLAILKGNDIKDFNLQSSKDLFPYTLGQAINRTNLLSAQQQAVDFNTYANRQKLPKQIDLMLSQIASNKSKVVTDQYQRRLLEGQAKLLTQKNYWYGLTEGQKYQMGNILQQSELYKQLLNQENISGKRLENSINQIRERNMRLGISNQATENAIKTLLQLAGKK